MMKPRITKAPLYSFIAAAALFLTGCSSTLDVKATSSKDISGFSLKLNFGPAITNAINTITGGTEGSPLISQEDVKRAETLSQFSNLKIKESTSNSITLNGDIATGNIISRTDRSLSICLSAENLNAFYKSLNEESRYYLDLLMAPVFTEDNSTKDEYIEFLGSIYGTELADEISQAYITINLQNPKDSKATSYSISLVQFLTGTLENSTFNIIW